MPSFIHTLKQVFNNVFLLSPSNNWENAGLSTYVIVATDRSFDPVDYRKSAGGFGSKMNIGYVYGESLLEHYLAERDILLITDDRAPTDVFVADLKKRQ